MKENSNGHWCDTAVIRLAILGASGVGKSALTVRFLTRRFIGEYESNVEYTYQRETNLIDTKVKYELRDGSAKVSLDEPEIYTAWATGIIIVYSIIDRKSFLAAGALLQDISPQSAIQKTRNCTTCRCISLVANKSDLAHRREIPREEGQNLAKRFSVPYYEVSASEDFENIYNSFKMILTESYLALNSHDESDASVENRLSEEHPMSPECTESEDIRPTTKRMHRKDRLRKRAERKQSVKRKLSSVIFKRKSDTMME